ncbi:MAG: hypothetical protein AB1634_09430 [Thermodesulfobacteriota bacterium]
MIEAIFFGLNILLVLLLWKKMLRPSILDHFRDKLFDLREEVRDFYVQRGIPLDSKSYVELRRLINGHLRYSESMTMAGTLGFAALVNTRPVVVKQLQDEIEQRYSVDDADVAEFIRRTRGKATDILFGYMLLSAAPWLLVLTPIAVILAILVRAFSTKIKRGIEEASYRSEVRCLGGVTA